MKYLITKLEIAYAGCESHEQMGFFKESIKDILDLIESLKCCGNCGNYNNKFGYDCCNLNDNCSRYSPTSGEDKWTIKVIEEK